MRARLFFLQQSKGHHSETKKGLYATYRLDLLHFPIKFHKEIYIKI